MVKTSQFAWMSECFKTLLRVEWFIWYFFIPRAQLITSLICWDSECCLMSKEKIEHCGKSSRFFLIRRMCAFACNGDNELIYSMAIDGSFPWSSDIKGLSTRSFFPVTMSLMVGPMRYVTRQRLSIWFWFDVSSCYHRWWDDHSSCCVKRLIFIVWWRLQQQISSSFVFPSGDGGPDWMCYRFEIDVIIWFGVERERISAELPDLLLHLQKVSFCVSTYSYSSID